MSEDTYMQPEHGWCCFFCGDVFTNHYAARQHFGATQDSTPACRIKAAEGGLLRQMRAFENQFRDLHAAQLEEDTELHRVIHRMEAEHALALRRAEEAGYTKGLHDGMALPAESGAV